MAPAASLKGAVVIVRGSIASLKVALGCTLSATPVAPVDGVVETTVGGVVAAAAPVVKVQFLGLARALPARPLARVGVVGGGVRRLGQGMGRGLKAKDGPWMATVLALLLRV